MQLTDSLVVTQQFASVPMPVFTCSLAPHREALSLAREAIDDLRAIDPNPMKSNVHSVYVSPFDSHYRTPKFGPLCEIIRQIGKFASKTYLSSDFDALGLDYLVKDCWGMIYESSDYTVPHNHFPAELSCAIYLEADPNCAPIIFGESIGIQPVNDLLVLFPGVLTHSVPATSGRRVVVSMNLFKFAKPIQPPQPS